MVDTPKNPYLNQATLNNTCQIFLPKVQKKGSKIPNQKKKSFDHPHRLKSGVPPWDAHTRIFHQLLSQNNFFNRLAFLNKHQILSQGLKKAFSEKFVKISDCQASSYLRPCPAA